jgi:hypothetical protein
MSWDLMLLPFHADWKSADDIPGDWEPGVIGPRGSVVAALVGTFPNASEDDDGRFDVDGMDILVGTEDPTDGVNINVYGGVDPTTLERIVRFAAALETRALDIQTGEFLTPRSGANSYNDWKAWRDRILESG